jgi:hypothetical protein
MNTKSRKILEVGGADCIGSNMVQVLLDRGAIQ